MSAAAPSKPSMTTEQMLALPDDGVERMLIDGVLREGNMARRSRTHARSETRVARFLDGWLDDQPEPRGEVVSGEAWFRLRRDPEVTVGIDVAYAAPGLVAATPEAATFFDGPPLLAVEILSPSDQQEQIDDKIALYLETGVLLVWILNPRYRTVTVDRPAAEPVLFSAGQELTAEPHLPGFRVPVASLFGR